MAENRMEMNYLKVIFVAIKLSPKCDDTSADAVSLSLVSNLKFIFAKSVKIIWKFLQDSWKSTGKSNSVISQIKSKTCHHEWHEMTLLNEQQNHFLP